MAGDTSVATGIAGRYAKALFEMANEQRALDAVRDDLAHIQSLLDESDDLRRVVYSPVLDRTQQGKAMLAVLDAAGISALVRNFIGVVAQNRRLFALTPMIKDYNELLADFRGEVVAEVTAATPLTDAQQDKIAATLKSAMGRDINIETRVDENLIGGMVVRVGSRMVDFSLATKLQGLRLAMKGVG